MHNTRNYVGQDITFVKGKSFGLLRLGLQEQGRSMFFKAGFFSRNH